MICTTRRPRTQTVYLPDLGNLLNELYRTPVKNVVKNERRRTSTPAVNIIENDESIVIELTVPGHAKKDINITIDNDVMTIKSNLTVDSDGTDYRMREFNFAGFEKAFNLPETIDQNKVSASFKNGILSITLDKKEEAKPQPPKSINIK
jgi:HSP20 family protein